MKDFDKIIAKFVIKFICRFRITKPDKIEIDGKNETYYLISNKRRFVTYPCRRWGKIYVSSDVKEKLTEQVFKSAMCHEIYHKYHREKKKLDAIFNKISVPKCFEALYQYQKKKEEWKEEIEADLFSTLKNDKRFMIKVVEKKEELKINFGWIDFLKEKLKIDFSRIDFFHYRHPPTELRKWIIQNGLRKN